MRCAVRLRDDVAVHDGCVLVGGSPTQVVRLSAAALALLDDRMLTIEDEASALLADRLLALNLADPVRESLPIPRASEMTVVVPVRDRAQALDRLLGTLGRTLRVVVVDDASHDSAAVAAVVERHGALLVSLAENRGPAAARNEGLRHVTTPLVAFVDSDVVITADALLDLGRHLADPRVDATAPRVRGRAAGAAPRWFERYEQVASSLDLGTTAATVRPWSSVAWVPSACLVARADAIGDGFDAAMRSGEDVDLVWRLISAGRQVRFDPAVEALHDTRGDVRGWLGRKVHYGTSGQSLAARHGDLVAPAVISPLMATAMVALLAQRRWSVPVALACTARTALDLREALPRTPARDELAVRLAFGGLATSVRQTGGLMLRHWWPLAFVGAVFSRRMRRGLVLAAAVDGVVAHRRLRPRMGVLAFSAARRLDDTAYGVGLWAGCLRARTPRGLLPRIVRRRRPARRSFRS